jgi:hypothetical protein
MDPAVVSASIRKIGYLVPLGATARHANAIAKARLGSSAFAPRLGKEDGFTEPAKVSAHDFALEDIVVEEPGTLGSPATNMTWVHDFEEMVARKQTSAKKDPLDKAVDDVFAAY